MVNMLAFSFLFLYLFFKTFFFYWRFGNLRRFLLFTLERPKQPVDEKDFSAASPQGAALGNCGWGSFSFPAGKPHDDLRGPWGWQISGVCYMLSKNLSMWLLIVGSHVKHCYEQTPVNLTAFTGGEIFFYSLFHQDLTEHWKRPWCGYIWITKTMCFPF